MKTEVDNAKKTSGSRKDYQKRQTPTQWNAWTSAKNSPMQRVNMQSLKQKQEKKPAHLCTSQHE